MKLGDHKGLKAAVCIRLSYEAVACRTRSTRMSVCAAFNTCLVNNGNLLHPLQHLGEHSGKGHSGYQFQTCTDPKHVFICVHVQAIEKHTLGHS